MGFTIEWRGGREILVRDGKQVIERHPTEPNQPRLAARRIGEIEQGMTDAALAMTGAVR